MTLAASLRRRLDVPLAMQILGLLAAGLVVSQLVTLALTLLLPMAPPPEYRLTDVATALRGGSVEARNMRPLVRAIRTQPPSLQSAGWMVSEPSRDALAKLLDVDPSRVRLLFYSPLPFAGGPRLPLRPRPFNMSEAESPPGRAVMAEASFVSLVDAPFQLAQLGPPGRGGGLFQNGGFAGGGFPAGRAPGGPPPDQGMGPAPQGAGTPYAPQDESPAAGGRRAAPTSPRYQPAAAAAAAPMGPLQPASRSTLATVPIDPTRAALARAVFRDRNSGDWAVIGVGAAAAIAAANAHGAAPVATVPPGPVAPRQALATTAKPVLSVAPAAPAVPANPPVEQVSQTVPAAVLASRPAPAAASAPAHADWVLPPPVAQGPFGSAPAGLVQADFVAALQVAPDRWVTVQPAPEPFPNRWQRRLLLWFALSFAIVAPIGYLFARRLVAPLATFSAAAERLGRDPSGPVLALEGPAEIGRAAAAFNLMQQRLKRYIDDRTAMVGAISHDLRTPLARIRFRVERVAPDVRAGILGDVTQMEEMISAVLIFIRDASEPGARERVDLRSIVECAVDDAALVGGDAVLDPGAPTSVEVDPLGVQRVVTNLIENALKYGKTARVRVFTEGDDSITEVADSGPGLADDELERVFLPFYRAALARTLHKGGIGLGLAVSRSIARAHGGDVRLYKNGGEGLVAQLRLPLADEV
jgi:two-component system OmpR family sensor kinase